MKRQLSLFDKDTKNIHGRENDIFNKCYWESWISTHIRMKLDYTLILSTKFNSKWIMDLSIRSNHSDNFGILVSFKNTEIL